MYPHLFRFRHHSSTRDIHSLVTRVIVVALLCALLTVVTRSAAALESQSPEIGAWQTMRTQLYGEHEIGEVDEKLMSLEAPVNTPDPAATPLTLRFGPDAAAKVKQVRLIIDNNPSPLATTMNLQQGTPIDEIDLRVRIDRFTSVRAIAEFDDGRLEMRSTWVKASGGCSAPPAGAKSGTPGEIRFRPAVDDKSLLVSIRHPNHSGFQIDPVSGDAIPPLYIYHLRLSSGGKTVLDADTGISLSENPSLRIASTQVLPAPLTLDAVDTTNAHFSAIWNGPAVGAAAGGH
jgi:sulfur-oxidizing protein SoxY